MAFLRNKALPGLLFMLLGAPIALLLHNWFSGPDIEAWYAPGSVRIANNFLTEYWLGMRSATLVDASTGRVLATVSCPRGKTFSYIDLRYGTDLITLDRETGCRIQRRFPTGFVFRRQGRLRVSVTGDNGNGVMRTGNRILRLAPDHSDHRLLPPSHEPPHTSDPACH
jgi:hypothetical protein